MSSIEEGEEIYYGEKKIALTFLKSCFVNYVLIPIDYLFANHQWVCVLIGFILLFSLIGFINFLWPKNNKKTYSESQDEEEEEEEEEGEEENGEEEEEEENGEEEWNEFQNTNDRKKERI